MSHDDRQDEQDYNPLAHKKGIARLFQKQAGILRRRVARIPNDEAPDQQTPDQPDHAPG
jgi:hypothetical protein